MKEIFSNLEKTILKKAEAIVIALIVLLCLFLSYSLYAMFNRSVDPKTLTAIQNESNSANITFDKNTISELKGLNKRYEKKVDTSQKGKNPFLTF